MSVRQISAFLQSKPGHLARMLELFEAAGVSVRGYSVSDTGEYGIGRFIVDDPDKAIAALEDEGVAHAETEVLCILLEDAPGRLAEVMKVFSEQSINVIYSYSMISTYIIINTDDVAAAVAALEATQLITVDQDDIRRICAMRAEEVGA